VSAPPETPTVRRQPALRDLRLALPAAAGLAGSVAAGAAGTALAAALALVFALAAVGAAAWALFLPARDPACDPVCEPAGTRTGSGTRRGRGAADRGVLGAIAVALVAAGACAGVQAAAHAAVDVHPLAGLVGGRTGVEAVVTGFARPTRGGGQLVPVRVEETGSGPAARHAVLDTVVLARGGWGHLAPGTRVHSSVEVLSPSRPGRAPALRALGGPRVLSAAGPAGRLPATVRERFREVADRAPGEATGTLLPSLVLGDESTVPEETREAFRSSGLAHLSAVSGANTTYVVGAVVLCAVLLGAGPVGRFVAGATGLGAFVAVVGTEPAVLRAAGTGVIGLLALAGRRGSRPLAALGAVVLAVALLDPGTATGPGFLLSVGATAGLVLLARPVGRRLRDRGVPGPVADTVAVCVVAQVVTTPVLLALGLGSSPWPLPANLLAAPVVPLVTVLGTAAAALAPLWPAGATALAAGCAPELWWLDTVARLVAGLPGGTMGA